MRCAGRGWHRAERQRLRPAKCAALWRVLHPVATVKLSVKSDFVRETIDAAGADNLNDVEQYLVAVARRPDVSNQLRAHNYTEADFVRIL